MFSYCGNNPICKADSSGDIWHWTVFGAVGALVNVATTFIAAKVTCQEYTWADAGIAALSGFCNAIPGSGRFISGAISGLYTGYMAYANGASLGGAFLAGTASAFATTCSIGNLAGLEGGTFELVTSATTDLVFGTGYNSMAAAVYKGVVNNSNRNTVTQSQTSALSAVQRITQIGNTRIVNGEAISMKNKMSFTPQKNSRIYCYVEF